MSWGYKVSQNCMYYSFSCLGSCALAMLLGLNSLCKFNKPCSNLLVRPWSSGSLSTINDTPFVVVQQPPFLIWRLQCIGVAAAELTLLTCCAFFSYVLLLFCFDVQTRVQSKFSKGAQNFLKNTDVVSQSVLVCHSSAT